MNRSYKNLILLIFAILAFTAILLISCAPTNPNFQEEAAEPEYLRRSLDKLTDVIVHDIFSPPVASRIYAYSCVAAYEVLQHDNPDYRTLAGQLHDLDPVPEPETGSVYCYPLSAVRAFLTVGKALIFSETKIEEFEGEVYKKFKALNMPSSVYNRSMDYGKQVAEHILAWANKDNYKETRTYPKYDIMSDEPGRWTPTPPDYMDGIEPHWNKIRTFVIDSAQQFIPPVPTEFSLDTTSRFFKEVKEVYDVGINLDEEQTEIAKFWDCNPYVSHHLGHVMYATKKITPGGHWMGIANIASRTVEADIMKTSATLALTSIALADAFISCWDEKYRSNLIRPETVINTHIDQDWKPLLQTPPFPEYTSGHSVISSAAATALTHIYGEPFAFNDTVEMKYGLPMRSFRSFYEASNEAAISRLYGGIHYLPACEVGVTQGRTLGKYLVGKISLKNDGEF